MPVAYKMSLTAQKLWAAETKRKRPEPRSYVKTPSVSDAKGRELSAHFIEALQQSQQEKSSDDETYLA
ncbi:hypothetical protein [Erwinia sp. 198]|jgi:hypothetical protein|uniref:hypothetical protein n=1 Tax=Erwinia sp. 198 TaxID=2022746 RepID=UPI000F65D4C1|nr:hypothetical protein [Erwinia sp. 198]RRZ89786.1 hypothetical protein EGK14_14905 [Erwinia sp. 198]